MPARARDARASAPGATRTTLRLPARSPAFASLARAQIVVRRRACAVGQASPRRSTPIVRPHYSALFTGQTFVAIIRARANSTCESCRAFQPVEHLRPSAKEAQDSLESASRCETAVHQGAPLSRLGWESTAACTLACGAKQKRGRSDLQQRAGVALQCSSTWSSLAAAAERLLQALGARVCSTAARQTWDTAQRSRVGRKVHSFYRPCISDSLR